MRIWLSGVLILVMISVFAIPAGLPAGAQSNNQIVFVSDQSGLRNLYVMDADGNNIQPLTSGDTESADPAWSPDRQQIAFSSNRDGSTFEIYVMNADGGNVRRLTNNSGATYNGRPTWSPDGQYIAFESNQSGKQDIFVVSTQGGTIRQLTRDAVGEAGMPAWSPDGRSIAYTSNISGHFDIFVMNTDGSSARPLTRETGADNDSPAWSPDGRQLAFSANLEGNSDIFLMDANGGNRSQLVSTEGFFTGALTWSPDGKSLAFMTWRSSQDRTIRVIEIGGSVRQLTEASYHAGWPSWGSPPPINTAVNINPSTTDQINQSQPSTRSIPPLNQRDVVPANTRRLGEFQVEWYCNNQGYNVTLTNGQRDWACTNPNNKSIILRVLDARDFDAICRRTYKVAGAFAIHDMHKSIQAYNWSCYAFTDSNPQGPPSTGITGQCPGALPSRLVIGQQGRVTEGGLPNRVRSSPDLTGRYLGQILPGDTFDVLDGPHCSSNMAWWKVDYNGLVGWTAEGQGDEYWLEPWQ